MQTKSQLKVGLLNDLHYDGGVQALNRLYESVAALNRGGAELLLVLGDLIDAESPLNAARMLREVSALCDSFQGPVRYMPGNHDLDHLSKVQFYKALGCVGDASTFGFRQGGVGLIGLDGNFSLDGREYDAGNFDWKASFIPEEQLIWLGEKLEASEAPVILFSHQRLDVPGEFSVQNHAAVREVIRTSGKVGAVFQGHQHADDLRKSDDTIYYTLGAHVDGAGPAMVTIDSGAVHLARDFSPTEKVSA